MAVLFHAIICAVEQALARQRMLLAAHNNQGKRSSSRAQRQSSARGSSKQMDLVDSIAFDRIRYLHLNASMHPKVAPNKRSLAQYRNELIHCGSNLADPGGSEQASS
jgi:hypothetical protein